MGVQPDLTLAISELLRLRGQNTTDEGSTYTAGQDINRFLQVAAAIEYGKTRRKHPRKAQAAFDLPRKIAGLIQKRGWDPRSRNLSCYLMQSRSDTRPLLAEFTVITDGLPLTAWELAPERTQADILGALMLIHSRLMAKRST